MHPYVFAHLIEVSLLQHAGPRSVAPSDCGYGQRCEEELPDFSLLQRQGSGDRKGRTGGDRGADHLTKNLSECKCNKITSHISTFCVR